MATFQIVDFIDIINAVQEELKIPDSDTDTKNRIKRNINAVYMNEVAPFKKWDWLTKRTDIIHNKFYNAAVSGTPDTVNVIEGSTTVTLSNPIPTSQGSKTDFLFAVQMGLE